MITFPWGYGPVAHPEAEEMSRLAYKMVYAIKDQTEDMALYVPGTTDQVFQGRSQ